MRAEKSKLLAYDHSQQQNEDHKHIHGTFHTKIVLLMSQSHLILPANTLMGNMALKLHIELLIQLS